MDDSQQGHTAQPTPDSATLTRRLFLRRTALTTVALSATGLLAACGGEATSATVTSAPAAGNATSASGAPTSAAAAATKPAGAASATGGTAGTTAPASPAAAQPLAAKPGGELFYAIATKFDTLDPNVTTFTVVGRMAYHLFDQLVREPKPGQFIPNLAEKWEVNPAGDEYTFYLRKDVMFHDGTPFNADAVKFTLDRIANPDTKSQAAFSALGPYASATVVDPTTIKVKFKSPYAPFLDSVAQPYLSPVSPTAVQKFGKDFGNNPVGTGPFKFDSYKTDNVVRFVKNPDYKWAPSLFKHQGAPFLDAISWRIINDPTTRIAAFKTGEVQFVEDVSLQNYAEFQSNSAFQLLEGVQAGSGYSMMNNVTKAPTDDVKVRQALEWATDRAGIIKTIWKGLYQPACSVLTSVTFGYDASTCQVYSYDPKKAGALLDEAGWMMSGDTRKKNGQDLVISLYYRSDNPDFVAWATFIQASFQQIGIKVDLHGLAQSGYFDAVRRGDHNVQFWWGPATDPDVVRQFFYSTNADGGTNRSRYKNPDMDKLIDQAASFTDPEKRKPVYAQIQQKALIEGLMVFIADSKNVFAYQKTKASDIVLDWSSTYPLLYDASMSK